MLRDILSLLWFQWKHLNRELAYWLKFLGFDPETSWMYRVYVVLFWIFWLLTVWGYGVDQAYRISRSLNAAAVESLLGVIPNALLVLQLLYLALVLRDPPLKLSAPDLSHVAAAPVQRGAIALVQFLRGMALPAVFLGLASALLSMMLSWTSAPDRVGVVGLQALFLMVLLVYISAAAAWGLSLLKLRPQPRLQRWLLWLALPLVLLAARLVPEVGLWAGRLWVSAVESPLTPLSWLWLLLALTVLCAVIVAVGQRVYMPLVADNSRVYARIQRLGWYGRIYAGDVIARIHRQTSLARKKHLRLVMPEDAVGTRALWSRSIITTLRFFPGSVIRPFARGVILAVVIGSMVGVGGWQTVQVWLLVLLGLLYSRPVELGAMFRDVMSAAFVQQFLPHDRLVVFVSNAAHALLFSAAGSLMIMLLLGWSSPLLIALMLLTLVAFALAQALEVVEVPLGFTRRLPYVYSVIVYALLVFLAGVALQSLLLAVVVAALLDTLMALMLRNSL